MAEAILAPEGHRVSGVSDGEAALRRLRDAKPDLVLLDTKMPRADGLAVCRSIRADPGLADVRVVMLAGPLDPFDRESAGAAGFDAVLQKPLDADGLLNAVNELLGGGPRARCRRPGRRSAHASRRRNAHRQAGTDCGRRDSPGRR